MDTKLWSLLLILTIWLPLGYSKGPPRVTSAGGRRRQIVKLGRTIKMVCPVEADPPPLLEWTKDGESINGGWDRFKTLSQGHLRIKDVMEDDSGTYVCKATNGFGSVNVDYMLYVVPDTNETVTPPWELDDESNYFPDGRGVPPQFSKPDQMRKRNLMRPIENSVRLKCKAHGKPKPDIIWLKDGEIFDHVKDNDESKWTLRLSDLQREDSGKYTCRVSNRAGSINYTYTLEVIDQLSKPIITNPYPVNTTVEYGQAASFQCQVQSDVQPTIQWLKRLDHPSNKNQNSTITVKGQQFVVLKTGKVWSRNDGSFLNKLTLSRVTEKDAGMYICLGANSMGYSFRSAFLTVIPSSYGQSDEDYDNVDSSKTDSDGKSSNLIFIIAIPAVAAVIVLVIVIIVLQRRRPRSNKKNVRQQQQLQQQQQRLAPVSPPQEKLYDQYMPFQPHVMQPMLQPAPSRERIMNTYSDIHSDVSLSKGSPSPMHYTPPPSMMQQMPPQHLMQPIPHPMVHSMPPPMHQHQHMHYGC